MKTKTIMTLMFIIASFVINGQKITKNLFSGSLGIGTENGKYGFMTALKYDRFVSNRLSIGFGINHMSNHRFIEKSYDDYYFSDRIYSEPTEGDRDLTYNSISANLSLNYYFIKKDKDLLNLSIGALTNLYQERLIQYITSNGPLSEGHVSITSWTYWNKITFQTSLEYSHFFNDVIGLKSNLYYSWAGRGEIVALAGVISRF